MRKKLVFSIFFAFFISILFAPYFISQQRHFQVIDVSGNEITINAGSRDGVKKDFTGRTFKESQYEGKTVPIYTAKFEIIAVQNDTCRARIISQSTSVERNQKIQFDQELIPLPQEGTLVVNSNPSRATVYVNGSRRGVTPLTLSLAPGTYRLRIIKSGYAETTDQITIVSNQSTRSNYPLTLIPQPSREGTLIVNSKPAGATVYLNGNRRGATPLTLTINAGTYSLRITKSDYEEVSDQITIAANQTIRNNYPLKPLPPPSLEGTLIVNTDPQGAKVYLNDVEKGQTPLTLTLEQGTYSLRITKTKYEKINEYVEIVANQITRYNYPLTSLPLRENDFGYSELLIEKDNSWMVLIPAGGFLMGSPIGEGEDNEYPQHRIYLDDFFIDKYEVTNAQYEKFVKDTGYQSEGDWRKYFLPGKENHPVVNVSWNDAAAYARWAGKRLPTEAEWEKAAHGALEGVQYPWGDYIDRSKANYVDSGYMTTQPVGSYPANGYGLFDMAGNIWEWCSDWYEPDYYTRSAPRNPSGPNTGTNRVFRGGAWASITDSLRVACRNRAKPSDWYFYLGFRCAKSD
jgi:formylglycine-generating enzyme required for sulfatase activity